MGEYRVISKGRSKTKAKQSISTLPKGIQQHQSSKNPFEYKSTQKRIKHDVLNRTIPGQSRSTTTTTTTRTNELAQSIQRRKQLLSAQLKQKTKVNSFQDAHIGEKKAKSLELSHEEMTLARIVKERVRRSKKSQKFHLMDDDDFHLTHKVIGI